MRLGSEHGYVDGCAKLEDVLTDGVKRQTNIMSTDEDAEHEAAWKMAEASKQVTITRGGRVAAGENAPSCIKLHRSMDPPTFNDGDEDVHFSKSSNIYNKY